MILLLVRQQDASQNDKVVKLRDRQGTSRWYMNSRDRNFYKFCVSCITGVYKYIVYVFSCF